MMLYNKVTCFFRIFYSFSFSLFLSPFLLLKIFYFFFKFPSFAQNSEFPSSFYDPKKGSKENKPNSLFASIPQPPFPPRVYCFPYQSYLIAQCSFGNEFQVLKVSKVSSSSSVISRCLPYFHQSSVDRQQFSPKLLIGQRGIWGSYPSNSYK